ncbi:hypothetical protein CBOM_05057 [Ceraceosorus bombacis]|uniref:Uncharacterized protein n=1 Tax=Ceraceosorus bombacis TaxID=401625 RepID=A0A0P1BHY6_9BASI|nr:hypothetical protein CBOM_05057 [Ceraceosorus bombacis]
MNRSLRLADLGKLSGTPVASGGGKLAQCRSSAQPIHCIHIWARFLLSLALLAVYIGSCIAQPIQEMSSTSSDATTMQQAEAFHLDDLLRTFKLQLADVKASNPDWASNGSGTFCGSITRRGEGLRLEFDLIRHELCAG